MRKLISLAIALACVGSAWAQTSATTEARKPIFTIQDLLETPEIAWSYRTEIIEGLSRSDVISNFEHDLQWLRENYLAPKPLPRSHKEAVVYEKKKSETRRVVAATGDLIARADRATVLVHEIRGGGIQDPEDFHKTLMELITIGRSHLIFGFEQFIMWRMRAVFPSCQIPLKS